MTSPFSPESDSFLGSSSRVEETMVRARGLGADSGRFPTSKRTLETSSSSSAIRPPPLTRREDISVTGTLSATGFPVKAAIAAFAAARDSCGDISASYSRDAPSGTTPAARAASSPCTRLPSSTLRSRASSWLTRPFPTLRATSSKTETPEALLFADWLNGATI